MTFDGQVDSKNTIAAFGANQTDVDAEYKNAKQPELSLARTVLTKVGEIERERNEFLQDLPSGLYTDIKKLETVIKSKAEELGAEGHSRREELLSDFQEILGPVAANTKPSEQVSVADLHRRVSVEKGNTNVLNIRKRRRLAKVLERLELAQLKLASLSLIASANDQIYAVCGIDHSNLDTAKVNVAVTLELERLSKSIAANRGKLKSKVKKDSVCKDLDQRLQGLQLTFKQMRPEVRKVMRNHPVYYAASKIIDEIRTLAPKEGLAAKQVSTALDSLCNVDLQKRGLYGTLQSLQKGLEDIDRANLTKSQTRELNKLLAKVKDLKSMAQAADRAQEAQNLASSKEVSQLMIGLSGMPKDMPMDPARLGELRKRASALQWRLQADIAYFNRAGSSIDKASSKKLRKEIYRDLKSKNEELSGFIDAMESRARGPNDRTAEALGKLSKPVCSQMEKVSKLLIKTKNRKLLGLGYSFGKDWHQELLKGTVSRTEFLREIGSLMMAVDKMTGRVPDTRCAEISAAVKKDEKLMGELKQLRTELAAAKTEVKRMKELNLKMDRVNLAVAGLYRYTAMVNDTRVSADDKVDALSLEVTPTTFERVAQEPVNAAKAAAIHRDAQRAAKKDRPEYGLIPEEQVDWFKKGAMLEAAQIREAIKALKAEAKGSPLEKDLMAQLKAADRVLSDMIKIDQGKKTKSIMSKTERKVVEDLEKWNAAGEVEGTAGKWLKRKPSKRLLNDLSKLRAHCAAEMLRDPFMPDVSGVNADTLNLIDEFIRVIANRNDPVWADGLQLLRAGQQTVDSSNQMAQIVQDVQYQPVSALRVGVGMNTKDAQPTFDVKPKIGRDEVVTPVDFKERRRAGAAKHQKVYEQRLRDLAALAPSLHQRQFSAKRTISDAAARVRAEELEAKQQKDKEAASAARVKAAKGAIDDYVFWKNEDSQPLGGLTVETLQRVALTAVQRLNAEERKQFASELTEYPELQPRNAE